MKFLLNKRKNSENEIPGIIIADSIQIQDIPLEKKFPFRMFF
jgi:hypothetical protein